MPLDANELIGTKMPAHNQAELALAAWVSRDYAHSIPYPQHAFGPQQWATDKPLPTALPYAQILTCEGAEFLFRGGSPQFSVSDDEAADALLQDVLRRNRLDAQWQSMAESAAHHGSIGIKWSVDYNDPDCPVRLTVLNVPTELRVWADPHDWRRILMARIQYPYRDTDGRWFYFREEYTSDLYVQYEPRFAGEATVQGVSGLAGYAATLGDGDDWIERSREANPYGVIPVGVVKNKIMQGSPYGEGDLWRSFRLMDRLAVAMDGEDTANQFHSEPVTAFLNATPKNVGRLAPGEPIVLDNVDKSAPAADIKMIEPSGSARQWTHATIDKWEQLLYKAVGLSRVQPEEVGNKGNLTVQALMMLYQRTIATSDRKRELWGASGMAVFFRDLLIGLRNLGGIKEVSALPDDLVVSCEWPAYFEETGQDVSDTTDRTIAQVDAGLLPPDRAAERLAKAEKIPHNEIPDLLIELKAHRAQLAKAQMAQGSGGGAGGTQDIDVAGV